MSNTATRPAFQQRKMMSIEELHDEARKWQRDINLREFLSENGWEAGRNPRKWKPNLDTKATNLHMSRSNRVLSVKYKTQKERWEFIDQDTKQGGTILAYPALYEGRQSGAESCNFIRDWLTRRGQPSGLITPQSIGNPIRSAADQHARNIEIDREFRAFAELSSEGLGYFDRRGLRRDFVLANAALIREIRRGAYVNPVFGYIIPPARNTNKGLVAHYEERWLGRNGSRPKRSPVASDKSGLWVSQPPRLNTGFEFIVVAESPIDAIAYAQMMLPPVHSALLVAFAGALTDGEDGLQMATLVELCERHLPDLPVLLAVDSDKTGNQYVEMIRSRVHRAKAAQPVGAKDWTEVLEQETGIR